MQTRVKHGQRNAHCNIEKPPRIHKPLGILTHLCKNTYLTTLSLTDIIMLK